MPIQSTDEVEGVPLLKIRALFRQAGVDGVVSADFVRRQLNLAKSKTDRLITALRRMGFLEPIRARRSAKGAEDEWQLSKNGIRLRGATAAKPLRRETAERLLAELLKRITALNNDARFLARVQKAVVFGSYLGESGRIGDLDVALQRTAGSLTSKSMRKPIIAVSLSNLREDDASRTSLTRRFGGSARRCCFSATKAGA